MQYYLYRHIRLDKNEPFYIGIGKKVKRIYSWITEFYRAFQVTNRNKWWYNVTSKTEYEVEIIYESDSVEEIKRKEIEFIALYGRKDLGKGSLVNLTDGGDGCVNYILTKEHIEAIRKHNTGREGTMKGKHFTKEHKDNISKSRLGIVPWNKGKSHSSETIQKMKQYQERRRLNNNG